MPRQAQRILPRNKWRENDIVESEDFRRNIGSDMPTIRRIEISHHQETARKKLLSRSMSLNRTRIRTMIVEALRESLSQKKMPITHRDWR